MLKKILSISLVAILLSWSYQAQLKAEPTPKPKQLILALGGESPTGYDPTLGWGRYGSPLFHSTLLTRDENYNVVADLATEHTLSDDRLVWNLKLRQDARFTDGQPLTAEDVVYTFQTAAKSASLIDLSSMEKIVAKGPYEVEIYLKKPEITFSNHLWNIGIVPKHLHKPGYARHPIGSGPYKFVEWNEGQQLIVKRNDDYYGLKPQFEELVFLFMSEDTAFAAAKTGQVHVVAVPQALAVQTIAGMKLHPVASVDNRGIMFPMLPVSGKKSTSGVPIGNDVTSNLAIRQAINYALNRQALVDGLLHGFGSPAYGLVDGLPWDEPAIRFKDNDLPRAKSILAKDGWKDTDGDGILEKGELRASFQLAYAATDQTRQNLVMIVRDQLKPLGIEVKPIATTWDTIYNNYSFNTPVLYGWGDNSPKELYQVYHSRTYDDAPDDSSFNPGRYRNPKVDAYLKEAQGAPSLKESLPLWQKAQWDGQTGPAAQGDAAWAWLVNLTHTYFADENLDLGKSAIEPHGHGWPLTSNIAKWKWVE